MNRKNSILGLYDPEKKNWISLYLYTYETLKFHAQLSWAWENFYNLGPLLNTFLLSPLAQSETEIHNFNSVYVRALCVRALCVRDSGFVRAITCTFMHNFKDT